MQLRYRCAVWISVRESSLSKIIDMDYKCYELNNSDLKLEVHGQKTREDEIDGIIIVEDAPTRSPAFVCSYNMNRVKAILANTVSATIALRETCESEGYPFNTNDISEWKRIAIERPDLKREGKTFRRNSGISNQAWGGGQ